MCGAFVVLRLDDIRVSPGASDIDPVDPVSATNPTQAHPKTSHCIKISYKPPHISFFLLHHSKIIDKK